MNDLPKEGAVSIALLADDLAAATRLIGSVAVVRDGSVTVPPYAATGIILVLQAT